MLILFSCLFDQKFSHRNSFSMLLFETQPAYVSKMFLNFRFMFLVDVFLTKKNV